MPVLSAVAPRADPDALERLVGFNTVSARPNRPLLEDLVAQLDQPGVRLRIVPDDDPGKGSLIAVIGPADVAGGLTLCGHTDVVPAEEPGWSSDPFTLTQRGDALHGRGACDMKGFVAVAVNRFLAANHDALRAPLGLLLTCDEEVGSEGLRRLLEKVDLREELPGQVLVGEPTGLQVVRMHKGHLKLRVMLTGQAAHTGTPHLGRNAIHAALPVLNALDELRRAYETVRTDASDAFADTPYPVLNVAMIHGGAALNIIPDRCDLGVGVRLLPGQDSDDTLREITGRVHAAAPDAAIEVIGDNPPFLQDEDAAIVREVMDAAAVSTSGAVPFASDAGLLARAGFECVLCGPGDMSVAHQADEYITLDQLAGAGVMVERLIEARCGEGAA